MDWNTDMSEAPEGEPSWIYVPAYDYVAGSVVVAERDGETWRFGEWEVKVGEISDDEGDEGQMIGPLAWMAIEIPEPPEQLDN